MTIVDNPLAHIADSDQRRAAFRDFMEQAFDNLAPGHLQAAEKIHDLITIFRQSSYETQLAGMHCNPAAGKSILALADQYLCDVQAQVFLDRPDLAEAQRQYESE